MLKGSFSYNGKSVTMSGYDFGDRVSLEVMDCFKNTVFPPITGVDLNGDNVIIPLKNSNVLCNFSGTVTYAIDKHEIGGVLVKSKADEDFLSALGGLLSDIKECCILEYREDALEQLADSFNPSVTIKYIIPIGTTGVDAEVYMCMGCIRSVSYTYSDSEMGNSISLSLEDDGYDYRLNSFMDNKSSKLAINKGVFQLPIAEEEDLGLVALTTGELPSISDIIDRNPNKDFIWLMGRNYEVVKTEERMKEVVEMLWKHDGLVSFDTETTGLKFTFKNFQGEGDKLVGMVFSIREGESFYFPVLHKLIPNICTESNKSLILEKYFKPLLETKPILCHNGAFDWMVMYAEGIYINLREDTQIAFQLTYAHEQYKMRLALKSLAKQFLNRDSLELSDMFGMKVNDSELDFSHLPEDSTKYYACADTDNTLALHNYIIDNKVFERFGARKIYEIEVAFSIVIAYQQFYGHCVDVERVEELRLAIETRSAELLSEMFAIAGHEFKPSSPKELKQVLFEEQGYPITRQTDKGAPSTGKKFIKDLIGKKNADGTDKYPLIPLLKEFKDNSLLKSNFINSMSKFSSSDGFIHSRVRQFLETGRLSTSDTNYQSYNDTVKKFIIPRKGFYMYDSDYSSVEYRILCSMAGEQNLVDKFFDPDMDYHTTQASRMFKVPYELVSKELRGLAKGINFGLPYGMGDESLGETLYGTKSMENTLKARKMRAVYFEGQANIEKFFNDAKREGVEQGYTETFFGRRRYYDKRVMSKGSIERQAGNFKIQGTAADLYKMAMVRLLSRIRKEGLLGQVLISCFVHDECVLEVSNQIDPVKFLALAREAMMIEIDGWCPLFVGAGYGRCWYEAKSVEIPTQVQEQLISGSCELEGWFSGTADTVMNSEYLCNWSFNSILDYKRDAVITYVKNPDNWGKNFSPVENGYAYEVLGYVRSGKYTRGACDVTVRSGKDIHGLLDNLKEFCTVFGILEEFEKADIQEPKAEEVPVDTGADTVSFDFEEEEKRTSLEIAKEKLDVVGFGYDTEGAKLYLEYDDTNPASLVALQKLLTMYPGTVPIECRKVSDGKYYSLPDVLFNMSGFLALHTHYNTFKKRG